MSNISISISFSIAKLLYISLLVYPIPNNKVFILNNKDNNYEIFIKDNLESLLQETVAGFFCIIFASNSKNH